MTKKEKVSADTIIRTIVLVVTLVNTILTMFGKNPLPWAEDEIYTALSVVAQVIAVAWAWWKNNSFTPEAIKADAVLKKLKNSKEG